MVHMAKVRYEARVKSVDFEFFKQHYSNDYKSYVECISRIEAEILRLQKEPGNHGKFCEYEPLLSKGLKKLKFYSSKLLQNTKGERTDMRIIFSYDAHTNELFIWSIGFRIKEIPRPKEDPYSQAVDRIINEQD